MTPFALSTGSAGSLAVVSLFAGVFVSIALAVLIAVRAFRGYRRTRSVRLLALSARLLLIVAVPKIANLGLINLTGVSPSTITVLTGGCRIIGLGVILASIYARS
jgi:hypothetical protein